MGLAALAAMRAADEANGIDPRAIPRAQVIGTPSPPDPGLRIAPPPWSPNHVPEPVPTADLVDELAPEDTTPTPAKPKPGKRRTPRLDAWRASQP